MRMENGTQVFRGSGGRMPAGRGHEGVLTKTDPPMSGASKHKPLTAIRAREVVLEELLESQSTLLGLATGIPRRKWGELGLRETAAILLRLVFMRTGGNFDQPDRLALVRALEVLQGSGNFLELGPVLLPPQARRAMAAVRRVR